MAAILEIGEKMEQNFLQFDPAPRQGRDMAETLLSFGVERLWKLLVRESERFQEVEEQFNGLKTDVEMLRCFLEDADAKKHTSAMVRNTIKDVKEIVLDSEDMVETFLIKKELEKSRGIKNNLRRFSCVILERRGLALEMESISKRISKVIRDMQCLGVQHVIVNERYTQSLHEIQREMRRTFSNDDNEDHLVGLEKNVKKLVDCLVEENDSQVVSIIGMGGLGKTTLARKVFNHETIKSHFAGLAWVCVSQQFTRKYVWQTILRQLRPDLVSDMTEDELNENLVRVLETQDTLIVIDDIWREEDWSRIKPVFLPRKGWKILLTSRNEGVALQANKQCVIFKPEYLTFEESWDLFQSTAFPRKNNTEYKADEEMEVMGKQMVKHCGGLPLAIKVLGGLLAAQYTLHEWKRVYENIKSHIIGGTSFDNRNASSVYHVLHLSFEELPIYLKHCFLYLAHFPEDFPICVQQLAYYWAAEGIPRPRYYDETSIHDVADRYIEELVKRNMVISERDVMTSRFEICHLHDMMREVCLLKAEEQNFLQIIQGTSTANSKPSCKSRRVVVHGNDETRNVKPEVNNPSVRTVLFLMSRRWKATSLLFTSHKLIRVLDLSKVEFEGGKLPSSIGRLIHLRYLRLYDACVTHLPSSMRNLKQLLYLCLSVKVGISLYMPNILKDMRELTYLHFPLEIRSKVKLDLGNLVNLETLYGFSTEHGSVSDLQGMTRLRILSINIKGKGCTMKTLSSSLSKLAHLENLKINNKKDYAPTNDEEGFSLDCPHLKKSEIDIYMPRLPDGQHFPFLLMSLWLWNCRLEEDPMPILEKLLHLKEVGLGKQSFGGKRMVCSGGGFPKLQKLLFGVLEEWEEWIIEEGSMPLLNTLHISYCLKLKKLPDGLRFITSLENLICLDMGEQWNKRMSEGGEDHHKLQHIPSVVFYG